MTREFNPTSRTRVRRLPQRGVYDFDEIFRILDEGFVCHVGFVVENQPYVIPTAYGRRDDQLYLHGSAGNRMLRSLAQGIQICVTVTLVDGLVLARSAFHHSINYRSVVILGEARVLTDGVEKVTALRVITENILPGRWEEVRQPTEQELNGTLVLVLPITEASAKVRTGPPKDEEEDYVLPIWAGELPLNVIAGDPVADPRLGAGVEVPGHLRNYRRSRD